jgi:nitroimidazol reductase NimA-like FMN-containing flavoprotein (pyridoxamine 5'-phosphate oxidase superfamily)
MAVLEGRTMLEVLNPHECWRRLANAPIGRLAVMVDSAPEIYPVNFTVDDGSVVFRTDPGSKLRGLDRSPSVAFQVDGIDPQSRTGWSVLLKGRAEPITSGEDVRRLMGLHLDLWAPGTKSRWIRIRPGVVTGRAIHPRAADGPTGSGPSPLGPPAALPYGRTTT